MRRPFFLQRTPSRMRVLIVSAVFCALIVPSCTVAFVQHALKLYKDSSWGSDHHCNSGEWLCDNKLCISTDKRCDGFEHCNDGSDEKECGTLGAGNGIQNAQKNNVSTRCADDGRWCADRKRCIAAEFVCDGKVNCADKSDESGCQPHCGQFFCVRSGQCVPNKWRCNGTPDCKLGEDEEHCSIQRALCAPGQFGCVDGSQCVSDAHVCDGTPHCNDRSDENGACGVNSTTVCRSGMCPAGQQCRQTPDADRHLCVCPVGSAALPESSERCEPLDACGMPAGWCEYECDATSGQCTCPTGGFMLAGDDQRRCLLDPSQPEPLIVFGGGSKVSVMRQHAQQQLTLARLPSDGMMDAVAFDVATGTAFWSTEHSGVGTGVMSKRSGPGAEAVDATPFVMSGVRRVSALAWDWVARVLYLSDVARQHVAACGVGGPGGGASACAVVARTQHATPLSVAVYPADAALFWSQQDGAGRGKIMRADLDGRRQRPLITKQLVSVFGMCIDMASRRLFWTNSLQRMIESARLDGSHRRTVPVAELVAPYSVAVLGSQLLWTDRYRRQISACDKHTGQHQNVLLSDTNTQSYHLVAAHDSLQPPMASACHMAECSHLCLLSATADAGYRCACPENMQLQADAVNCRYDRRNTVLVANQRAIVRMSVDVLGRRPDESVPHVRPRMLTALTVAYIQAESSSLQKQVASANTQLSPLETQLVLADTRQQQIVSYRPDGRKPRTLVRGHMGLVTAVVVDAARQLLYWADSRLGSVQAVRLGAPQHRRTIASGIRFLVHMTAAHEFGVLLVAVGGQQSAIYTVEMDGSGRRWLLVTESLPAVSCLSYDDKNRQLYWTELYRGNIGRVELFRSGGGGAQNGKSQSQGSDATEVVSAGYVNYFRSSLLNPFSVATLDGMVYWLTTHSRRLFWTNASRPEDHVFQQPLSLNSDTSEQLLHIASGSRRQLDDAVRRRRHSNCPQLMCQHLCVSTNQGRGERCACADGYQLADDNRSCKPVNCTTTATTANDASNSTAARSTQAQTHGGTFVCGDGHCVAAEWRCDRELDCADGSDEQNCAEHDWRDADSSAVNCSSGGGERQFTCASRRQCVPEWLVCNAVDDCGDDSDEQDCQHTAKCPSNQDDDDDQEDQAAKFRCGTGACIDADARCDGFIDCSDASDERSCHNSTTCQQQGLFGCASSGLCIKAEWFCDGHADCHDLSDEPAGCTGSTVVAADGVNTSCAVGSRGCPGGDTSVCVDERLWCDCNADCPHGEDEADCGEGEEYRQRCEAVEPSLEPAGSRAPGNTGNSSAAAPSAGGDESMLITCRDAKHRIFASWMCDGQVDCPAVSNGWDESDEQCNWPDTATGRTDRPSSEQSSQSEAAEPAGASGRSLNSAINCSSSNESGLGDGGVEMRVCTNGWQCVPLRQFCNGLADCEDGSDESGQCGAACSHTSRGSSCQHLCQPTPDGAVCRCHDGYRLHQDGRQCVDIDECSADWSPCWQRCRNVPGTFRCACADGYWLEGDGRACRAQQPARLLLATGRRVISRRVMDAATGTHHQQRQDVKLVWSAGAMEVQRPTLLLLDQWTGRLVFHEGSTDSVFVTNSSLTAIIQTTNNSSGAGSVKVTGSSSNDSRITALAYDWHAKNVYVAESHATSTSTVRVCNLRGHCSTVYRQANETLEAMVVAPELGTLYACGRRMNVQSTVMTGFVMSVAADGTGRRRLLHRQKLGACGGIDIDRAGGRLWWSDRDTGRLMTTPLTAGASTDDDNDRQPVSIQLSAHGGARGALYRPAGVAVFDHWVYAAEADGGAVRRCRTHVGLSRPADDDHDQRGRHQVALPAAAAYICQQVYAGVSTVLALELQHRLRQPPRAGDRDSLVGACERHTRCAFLCVPQQQELRTSDNKKSGNITGRPDVKHGVSAAAPALTCLCPDTQPKCQLQLPAASLTPQQRSPKTSATTDKRSAPHSSESNGSGVRIAILTLVCVGTAAAAFIWLIYRRRRVTRAAATSTRSHGAGGQAAARASCLPAAAAGGQGGNGQAAVAGGGRRFQNPVYGVEPPAPAASDTVASRATRHGGDTSAEGGWMLNKTAVDGARSTHATPWSSAYSGEAGESAGAVENATVDVSLTDKLVE